MKFPLMLLALLIGIGTAMSDEDATGVSGSGAGDASDFANNSSFVAELAEMQQLIDDRDYRGAARELKRLSLNNKMNPEVWQLLGVASHKKGDYLGSKVAFEKSLKLNPDDEKTLSLQAELFLSIGDKNSARSNLDKLEKLCPNGCDSRARLSEALSLL